MSIEVAGTEEWKEVPCRLTIHFRDGAVRQKKFVHATNRKIEAGVFQFTSLGVAHVFPTDVILHIVSEAEEE